MSLSFACPACKAQMEVPDELAGQTGQCPRCQHVFIVPAPQQPPARPVSVGTTRPGETSIPPTDPWADQEKPKPVPGKLERPRRTRAAAPPQPSGPLWPWFVAILGALIVGGLLLSSFIVLVAWRQPQRLDPRPLIQAPLPAWIDPVQGVTVGRLQGNRAFMDQGVFQVRGELTHNDPLDPMFNGTHCKRYEIDLIANRTYIIEQDSNQFDCLIRIFNLNGQAAVQGNFGIHNAKLFYTPMRNEIHTIYATCMQPAFGHFTLTVREKN